VQTWSETELGFRRERYAALKAEWEAVRSVSPEQLAAQVDPPRLAMRPTIETFIGSSGLKFFDQSKKDSDVQRTGETLRGAL